MTNLVQFKIYIFKFVILLSIFIFTLPKVWHFCDHHVNKWIFSFTRIFCVIIIWIYTYLSIQCYTQIYFCTIESIWFPKYSPQSFWGKVCKKSYQVENCILTNLDTAASKSFFNRSPNHGGRRSVPVKYNVCTGMSKKTRVTTLVYVSLFLPLILNGGRGDKFFIEKSKGGN